MMKKSHKDEYLIQMKMHNYIKNGINDTIIKRMR